MEEYSDENSRINELRSRIVGLGRDSLRKNYFPQLQEQINALNLAKEKAEENEKKFSLIFNNTSDGIILVAPDTGQFYLCNQTACRMFGYSEKEMATLKIWDLFAKKEKNDILDNMISKSMGGRTALRKIEMQTLDGSSIYCDINPSYVEIEGSNYLLTMFRDITELARAEEETEEIKASLLQSQKMEAIGTLAGGIAHDFNNILSGIFGFSQLARTRINNNNPEKAAAYIDQIIKGAEKAADLTQQILAFSRESVPEKHLLPLSQTVKEALKLLRSIIPSSIEMKVDIHSTACVMADPTRIHQLIMNFCTNAYHAMHGTTGILSVKLQDIDFTREKCTPDISIRPGKYLALEVKDTGMGMDRKTLGKIFDPYFTTKKEGQGTGLGLSIAQVVVKEHNGYIKVESEPGKGSLFRVYFPVVEKKRCTQLVVNKQALSKSGTETILLVDDEKMLLNVSRKILENRGYKVIPFLESVLALEAFKKEPEKFDLVVTDMTMPRMEGDQLAIAMLKIRPELPIILCTGYNDNISEERALKIGVRKYMEKPLVTKELGCIVREVLDSC